MHACLVLPGLECLDQLGPRSEGYTPCPRLACFRLPKAAAHDLGVATPRPALQPFPPDALDDLGAAQKKQQQQRASGALFSGDASSLLESFQTIQKRPGVVADTELFARALKEDSGAGAGVRSGGGVEDGVRRRRHIAVVGRFFEGRQSKVRRWVGGGADGLEGRADLLCHCVSFIPAVSSASALLLATSAQRGEVPGLAACRQCSCSSTRWAPCTQHAQHVLAPVVPHQRGPFSWTSRQRESRTVVTTEPAPLPSGAPASRTCMCACWLARPRRCGGRRVGHLSRKAHKPARGPCMQAHNEAVEMCRGISLLRHISWQCGPL
jgi:hypothetical protein